MSERVKTLERVLHYALSGWLYGSNTPLSSQPPAVMYGILSRILTCTLKVAAEQGFDLPKLYKDSMYWVEHPGEDDAA